MNESPEVLQAMDFMHHMIQEFENEQKFMGSVLVSKGSQLLFKRSYGFANLEWDIPNEPNTKMQIASVTKQFTAAAILLLQERGKLNIHDPVKLHLTDSPATWDEISMFHLLTHTSGLHNYTDADIDEFFKPMGTVSCTPENVTGLIE